MLNIREFYVPTGHSVGWDAGFSLIRRHFCAGAHSGSKVLAGSDGGDIIFSK